MPHTPSLVTKSAWRSTWKSARSNHFSHFIAARGVGITAATSRLRGRSSPDTCSEIVGRRLHRGYNARAHAAAGRGHRATSFRTPFGECRAPSRPHRRRKSKNPPRSAGRLERYRLSHPESVSGGSYAGLNHEELGRGSLRG